MSKLAKRFIAFLFFLIPLCASAQITGVVISDDDNTPLKDVTITVKETKAATKTNDAGYYSIAAQKGQTLVFTFVGYVKQEISIVAQTNLNVTMVLSQNQLGEVVITGYGQKKNKRELAYQVTTVNGDDIAQTRRTNFLNALAGRVPGLTVTSTSGLPGASASIMLRGGSSIGGNNQPLFVVDGLPMYNGSVNQEDLASASNTGGAAGNLSLANRNSDYTNRIADINPDDIESVVILKGPEATAMYGSDGASGAIVITTKKGGTGKTKITYSNSFSVSEVYRFPKIQQVYTRGLNGIADPTAYGGGYGFLFGYQFFGPKYAANTTYYDNIKNFFVKGFTQQHNLSLTAGTNLLNYVFTAGFLNQGGVVPNTEYTKYNFRFTATAQLNKRIKMTTSWAYTAADNNKAVKGAGSFYTNLMTFPSDVDARDYINADGSRKILRNVALSTELNSPYWDVNKNKSNDKSYNLNGNVNLTGTIAKGLTATAIIGINHFTTLGLMAYHPQSRESFSLGGYLSTFEQVYNGLNGTARINYRKSIKNIITNDAYVGVYFEDNKSTLNAQRGERFYEADFVSLNNTDPVSRLSSLQQYEIRKERAYAGYTFGYKNLFSFLLQVQEKVFLH